MSSDVLTRMADNPANTPHEEAPPSGRPRHRRRWILLLGGVGVIVVLGLVAGLWFLVGRESASEVGEADALKEFRSNGGVSSDNSGLPAAGVYAATADGTESVGIPGLDEDLGPNSPVTVTHGKAGCFTYRADFNSHHWRSWTFCPSDTATFALARTDGWTARKAPGLDVESLNTYSCEDPLDVLWKGATAGDVRTGLCRGTSDLDDSITMDSLRIEVIGSGTVEVDGVEVDVIHARTTETFSQDQTGTEVDEWWIDATTGLPLRIVVDSNLSGGAGDYREQADLRLTVMKPAT